MRKINLSAGPSALPSSVREEAARDFFDYQGQGFGIAELSHRSSIFESLLDETFALAKALYELNDDYECLLVQGGASMQFALLAQNLALNEQALYVDTDVWTANAFSEALLAGAKAKVIASSKEASYSFIPKLKESDLDKDASYLYICSNNTVSGTQYKNWPKSKAPLIVDASSELFSKPLEPGLNLGMLYGGLQKNAGIAGLSIIFLRKDLLERSKTKTLPKIYSYDTYAKSKSMFNTPPTFTIYVLLLLLRWCKAQGGLSEIAKKNERKAALLYDLLDQGFYSTRAAKEDRSLMNVCFKAPSKEQDDALLKLATDSGFMGLAGHRLTGGLRASIYNACSYEEVEKLCALLKDFANRAS